MISAGAATVALGASMLSLAAPANATIVVTLEENGPQIDATLSGFADVSAFSGGQNFPWSGYEQDQNFILLGDGDVTRWDGGDVPGGFTGSGNTGSLTPIALTTTGGMPPVGILPNGPFVGSSDSGIYLPTGYSGEVLSASTSIPGSFAAMGMTVGDIYSVSWQSNGFQSFEFRVIPEPATATLLLLGLGLVGALRGPTPHRGR